MSMYYICRINLNINLDENILKKLIEKGSSLGFKYLQRESYSQILDESKTLSETQALKHIILGYGIKSEDHDFPRGLAIAYEELLFSIDFYERNNELCLRLLSLSTEGEKIFQGKEYFDFGRHVELLIKLCEDYPISKIETHVD